MIVQYNKITPENRNLVRSIESKGYVGYVRYLLLKRWPFERVIKELMRLGLAWNEQTDFETYFCEVLYPIIQKAKLTKYYKKYRNGMNEEALTIKKSFRTSEKDRIAFIDMLHELDVIQFFSEEIIVHYGGLTNIPNHPLTGEPIIQKEKPVDLVEVLQNPKRHLIELFLLEGYSPKQITEHLFERYEIDITPHEISIYAKSFFNVKRQDVQRMLENIQSEKETLEKKLLEVKRMPPENFSVGERFEIVSAVTAKINELSAMIRKLSSVHSNATFNSAVLELSDVRDMFKDVMVKAHRRFRDMDDRTEDDVVDPLGKIVSMMSKATDKIMGIEEVLNQKTTKSINEEMLEVIMPSLDRIEQEEREAMLYYKNTLNDETEDDENDILGLDI